MMLKKTFCLSGLALLRCSSASWIPQQVLSPFAWSKSETTATSNLPLVIWHGLGDKYEAIEQTEELANYCIATKPTAFAPSNP